MRDKEVVEKTNFPRCIVPGCPVEEPGVGTTTCVIWGKRRLCYETHFPLWDAWQLAHDDRAPTESEWVEFVASVSGESASNAA